MTIFVYVFILSITQSIVDIGYDKCYNFIMRWLYAI